MWRIAQTSSGKLESSFGLHQVNIAPCRVESSEQGKVRNSDQFRRTRIVHLAVLARLGGRAGADVVHEAIRQACASVQAGIGAAGVHHTGSFASVPLESVAALADRPVALSSQVYELNVSWYNRR